MRNRRNFLPRPRPEQAFALVFSAILLVSSISAGITIASDPAQAASTGDDTERIVAKYVDASQSGYIHDPVDVDGEHYFVVVVSSMGDDDPGGVDDVYTSAPFRDVLAHEDSLADHLVAKVLVFRDSSSGPSLVPRDQNETIQRVIRADAARNWIRTTTFARPTSYSREYIEYNTEDLRSKANFWYQDLTDVFVDKEDRYLAALQAMTTTDTRNWLIPADDRETITSAGSATESAANAIEIANRIEDEGTIEVGGRIVDAALASKALRKYAADIKHISGKIKDNTNHVAFAASLSTLVLSISEEKVYSEQKVQMLRRLVEYDENHPGVSLDPELVDAIETLEDQHEDMGPRTRETVYRWIEENGIEVSQYTAETLGPKFATWLTAHSSHAASLSSWATSSSGGVLISGAAKLASTSLLTWQVGGFLLGKEDTYLHIKRAQFSEMAMEEFKAVDQHIRSRYGPDFKETGPYAREDIAAAYQAAAYFEHRSLAEFYRQEYASMEAYAQIDTQENEGIVDVIASLFQKDYTDEYDQTKDWAEDALETSGTLRSTPFDTVMANYPDAITNTAPSSPGSPSPSSGTDKVSTQVTLDWSAHDIDSDTLSYDLYLEQGTSNPTNRIAQDLQQSQYTPSLEPGTTYYWKVVATDEHGKLTTSETWSFTTVPQSDLPSVSTRSPSNGAGGVAWSTDLSWDASDPNNDDLSYTVYLGTNQNPGRYAEVDSTSVTVDGLQHGTTYYWKVAASDGTGTTETPVRSFTTASDSGSLTLEGGQVQDDHDGGDVVVDLPDGEAFMDYRAESDRDAGTSKFDVRVLDLDRGILVGTTRDNYQSNGLDLQLENQNLFREPEQYRFKIIAEHAGSGDTLTKTVSVTPSLDREDGDVLVYPENPITGETVTLDASHLIEDDGNSPIEGYEWGIYREQPSGISEVVLEQSGASLDEVSFQVDNTGEHEWMVSDSSDNWQIDDGSVWPEQNIEPDVDVTDFSVPNEATAGTSFQAEATLENSGSELGHYVLRFKVDGTVTEIDALDIDPAEDGDPEVDTERSDFNLPPGDHTISIEFIDAHNNVHTESETVTVVPNDPPAEPNSPTPGDDEEKVDPGSTLRWDSTDPDNDQVTYDVRLEKGDSSPDEVVASDLTEATFTPGSLDRDATYYWQILARDEHGASTSGPVWSFRTNVNEPPELGSHTVSPEEGLADTTYAYFATASDPDGDTVDIGLEVYDPSSDSWESIGSMSVDGSGEATWSTAPFDEADEGETSQYRFAYDDGQGHAGTWGPFDGPHIDDEDTSGPTFADWSYPDNASPGQTVPVSVKITDPSGIGPMPVLSYTLPSGMTGSTEMAPTDGDNVYRGTIPAPSGDDVGGEISFNVTAEDDDNTPESSRSIQRRIPVKRDNAPPQASLRAEPGRVSAGDIVRLNASTSTDPDEDDLDFTWELRSRPEGASPDLPEGATGTVTLSRVGTYRFAVTVSDGTATDTATVTVAVRPDGDEAWPMFQFDSRNTGHNPDATPPLEDITTRWAVSLDASVRTAPAVANGTLYIGSDAAVRALDADTGEERWQFTDFQTDDRPYKSLAVRNGTVYVSTAGSGNTAANLYALDTESGIPDWSFQTPDRVKSPPTLANGSVYFGDRDGNVYALDATTGDPHWTFDTGSDKVAAAPAVANGTVYVGSKNGKMYALAAGTGEKRWETGGHGEILSSAAVVDRTVYFGSKAQRVFALDANTGSQRWTFDTNGEVHGSPAVANGTVFVGDNDDTGYALDATTGDKIWGTDGRMSSPAVANGTVVFSSNGIVRALAADSGTEYWRHDLGGGDRQVAVVNRTVYVATTSGSAGHAYALSGGQNPPTARLLANSTKVTVGDAVRLNASTSSDPNGDDLGFTWKLLSSPQGVSPGLPDAGNGTVTFPAAGTYEIEVTVSDGQVTDNASVTIAVDPANRIRLTERNLPLRSIWSVPVDPDKTDKRISVHAADTDGDDRDEVGASAASTTGPSDFGIIDDTGRWAWNRSSGGAVLIKGDRASADITGNGSAEIMFMSRTGGNWVRAYTHNGTVPVGGSMGSLPSRASASDADGDGRPELMGMVAGRGMLRLWDDDGSLVWDVNDGHVNSDYGLRDVDGDSKPELLTNAKDGRRGLQLVEQSGTNGLSVVWTYGPDAEVYARFAQLRPDAAPEVLVAYPGRGEVHAVDGDGTQLWTETVSSGTVVRFFDAVGTDTTDAVFGADANLTVVDGETRDVTRVATGSPIDEVHAYNDSFVLLRTDDAIGLANLDSGVFLANASTLNTRRWDVGDVTGDGRNELVLSRDAEVAVYAPTHEREAASPVAALAASSTTVTAGSTVELDASGSTDPNGDDLTYSWDLVSGPDGASHALPAGANGSVTLSTVGTYVIEVTVSDGVHEDNATVSLRSVRSVTPLEERFTIPLPHEKTTLTPADTDGDGADEIGLSSKSSFGPSAFGLVDDGAWHWNASMEAAVVAGPAADVDGDGAPDVVFQGRGGAKWIRPYGHDGSYPWSGSFPTLPGGTTAADWDDDGKDELLATAANQGHLVLWDDDGSVAWQVQDPERVEHFFGAQNVTGDDFPEVLTNSPPNDDNAGLALTARNGSTGARTVWTYGPNAPVEAGFTQIDDDPAPEVIAVYPDTGDVHGIDDDGSAIWNDSSSLTDVQVAFDARSPDNRDAVIWSGKRVAHFDSAGEWNTSGSAPSPIRRFAPYGDEGAIAVTDANISILLTESRLATTPRTGTVTDIADGDVDGDGTAEVIVGYADRLVVLDRENTPPAITDFSVDRMDQRRLRVAFESSEPLSAIRVPIDDEDNGTTVRTLTEANFTEQNGVYRATVDVENYGTYAATLESAADVDGTDGAAGQSGSVVLPSPTVDVRIELTEPDGTPATNSTVIVESLGDTDTFETVFTDASGTASVRLDRDTEYELTYHQQVIGAFTDDAYPPDGTPDVYALGRIVPQTTNRVDRTLPAGHPLNVTVVDESGDPVADAGIEIYHENGEATAVLGASSDAQGRLVHGLDERVGVEVTGSVDVVVTPPPDQPLESAETSLSVSSPTDETVVLPATVQPELRIGSARMTRGGTAMVDVTLSEAPDGLAGFEFNLTVANGSVAAVSNASYPDTFSLSETPTVGPDNETVHLKALDLESRVESGDENVTLARIELQGTAAGETNLTAESVQLDDDVGSAIDPVVRDGRVTVTPLSPVCADCGVPSDPDGDGVHEDVNGNDRLDFDDVVTLFENMDDAPVTDHESAFDVNGNDRLDFDDIVELFEEI